MSLTDVRRCPAAFMSSQHPVNCPKSRIQHRNELSTQAEVARKNRKGQGKGQEREKCPSVQELSIVPMELGDVDERS